MRKLVAGTILLMTAAIGLAGTQVGLEPATRESHSWPAGRGPSQTVYVKSTSAELRSGPGPRDAVVAKLNQGDALSVVAAEPARLRVKTAAGVEGYIAKLHTADKRPSGVGGGQLILAGNSGTTAGANASSIRGLSPMAEQYAKDFKLSREAVDQVKDMEAVGDQITPTDVDAFAAEGGIVAP